MTLKDSIKEYREFIEEEGLKIAGIAVVIAALDLIAGSAMPPRIEYKDMNKDGIADQVRYQRVLFFPKDYSEKSKIFYGVKISGGKTIYLPKNQIDGLEKR
jgi:hypothetical protein